ncbi:MAG: class I SAM-dependent methyltransferase, partial [Gammaproteobacteria bacterium]
ILDDVFGDQIIQIGPWAGGMFLKAARTRRTVVIAEEPGAGVQLISRANDLAIPADSIDAVLLAHILESHGDPHAVLREVDRILRPDGQLIVAGFNPYGTWGFRHLLSGSRFPPGTASLISDRRLKDWLRLLNFSIQRTRFYHFQLPLGSGPRAWSAALAEDSRAKAWAKAGSRKLLPGAANVWHRKRLWPPLAACYVMTARKEMYTSTMIHPVRRRRRRLVAGLVNPTSRNAA